MTEDTPTIPWEWMPQLTPMSMNWRMAPGEDIQHAWLAHVRAMGMERRLLHLDDKAAPALWRFWLGEVIGPDAHSYLPLDAVLGPDVMSPMTGKPAGMRARDGRTFHDWMKAHGKM